MRQNARRFIVKYDRAEPGYWLVCEATAPGFVVRKRCLSEAAAFAECQRIRELARQHMNLKFSDQERFDLEGPYRVELRKDGWYVIGRGTLTPVATREEGLRLVQQIEPPDVKTR